MYGPPPRPHHNDGVKKPKSFKELPAYIGKVIKGFFFRYFYIFKLVWEANPFVLIVMSITTILNGLFPVLGAFITAEMLNEIVDAYNMSQNLVAQGIDTNEIVHTVLNNPEINIVFWIVAELAYLIVKNITSNFYTAFINVSGERVANHIKIRIISKSKKIDISHFDMPEFYEKLENATREASFRPIQIINSSFTMISNIISVISFVIVLFDLTPIAPFIVIAMALPATIIKFIFGRKNFLYMRRHSKERRQMEYYSNVLTNKDVVKEVRLFNLSDTFISKFKAAFKKYFTGFKKLIFRESTWHIIVSAITACVNAGLFLYVALQVASGKASVGDYSLYSGSLNSIISCVGTIVAAVSTVYQGTLFIDNVIEFDKLNAKIIPIQNPPLFVQRHIAHTIEFKNVSFSYPHSDKLVLKNVSFKLEKGTTTVLVGLNGAGKTTIIKLLTRLYDPTEGIILLDGEDIRKYDVNNLYEIFGTIFQDFGKYALTINENIYFGDIKKGYNEHEIIAAAQNSGANVFIEKLPEKYDTNLMKLFEDNSTELSIGQWQKISVARAFYSDSDILILDEPTASLDALAEQQIFRQFELLTMGKTSIFVSHRLSSATTADNIIVLEYGQIVEQGNHKELMKKRGAYYDLFSTQAKRYIENQ